MARGRKTGGRKKGTPNKATTEVRAAALASGMMPLDYMLSVMRDDSADIKRRDAMSIAAAPYLHAKVSAEQAPVQIGIKGGEKTSIQVSFVVPKKANGHDTEEE